MIVDFCLRRDGRPRIFRRRLLFYRDGRCETGDEIGVGLIHPLQKLPSVRAQAFYVTPLALGIYGIEGERRLSGTRRAGEYDQLIPRQVEVDILQIVLACAPDYDVLSCRSLRSIVCMSGDRSLR